MGQAMCAMLENMKTWWNYGKVTIKTENNHIWEDHSNVQRTVLSGARPERPRDACNGDGQEGKNVRAIKEVETW